jgi:hypothetical protein
MTIVTDSKGEQHNNNMHKNRSYTQYTVDLNTVRICGIIEKKALGPTFQIDSNTIQPSIRGVNQNDDQ